MRKASGGGVGVGSSSILVIFILLCLTTFATLSLVSANADLRLSEKNAMAAAEYYRADGEAETLLAQINEIFMEESCRGLSGQDFADACMKRVRTLIDASAFEVFDDRSFQIWYQVPVNEAQSVSVKLLAQPGGGYLIKEWRVVPAGEWEPESDGFYLWDGGYGDAEMTVAEPPTAE